MLGTKRKPKKKTTKKTTKKTKVNKTGQSTTFELSGTCTMIGYSDKAKTGSEDACFLHKFGMGTADGVSAWALKTGVSAAVFAKALMALCNDSLNTNPTLRDPTAILTMAQYGDQTSRFCNCIIGHP